MDYFSTFNRMAEKSLGFTPESFASQGAGILFYINSGDSCPNNSSDFGNSGSRCKCDEGYRVNSNADGCEAIPPPPTPPSYFCKSYSASDLDTWAIDGSMWDSSTSQNIHNYMVRANIPECYHWTLDSTTAATLNSSGLHAASSGDVLGLIVYEIPYTECGKTTIYHSWSVKRVLFKRGADGTFTQYQDSSGYFMPTFIGTNDVRYDYAIISTTALGQSISSPYPQFRLTNAQRSSIISGIVNYWDGILGSHTQEYNYDDCLMRNQSPPRWVTDESGGNRGIEWSEGAQECKCGLGKLRVSIVFEELQIGSQASTKGRFSAFTNCPRNWSDHTSEILPLSNGNYNKATLYDELEDLKTRSRNYLANCDQEKLQQERDYQDRKKSDSCDVGYQNKGECPDNSYKQQGGGGLIFTSNSCWRCVCKNGYVSDDYEQDTDTYIVSLDGECTEQSCMDNAYYDTSLSSCVCLTGYEKNEDGTVCNPKNLIPIDGECTEHSTLADDGNCYCNAGYIAEGDKCVSTSTNGNETWDFETHLKEYGMWYGLGFLGFVALKAFSGGGE